MVGSAWEGSVLGWMLAAVASAEQDPNLEILPTLAVTRGPTGWGVDLGATVLLALGDHCSWIEVDCRGGTWWPTVGPRVSGGWRGGKTFGGAIEGVLGVGAIDMYQFGFLPVFRAEAVVGVDFELGQAPLPVLGGQLTKSLSLTIPSGGGVRILGLEPLSVAAGARKSWGRPLRWSGGLEVVTHAGSYE